MHSRYVNVSVGLRTFGVLILGLGFVTLYFWALWKAPSFLVNQGLLSDPGIGPEHRLNAEHNARLIVISVGGALVVLGGLLYTARNYKLAHRGQVTERFTKALERINSNELYVRIGGLHALEHVMQDSPGHHGDVVEVLVAFIRDRAPRRADQETLPQWLHPPIGTETLVLPSEPDADVQSALTVLVRRPSRAGRERKALNLRGLHLVGAHLEWAQLHHADLAGTQLEGAFLERANLTEANLTGVQLQDADLLGANLRGARLQQACLVRTNLQFARLNGADLTGSRLHGAAYRGAIVTRQQLDLLKKGASSALATTDFKPRS